MWSGQPYFESLYWCCSTLRGPQSSLCVLISLPLSVSWLRGAESSFGNRSHQKGRLAPDDGHRVCFIHAWWVAPLSAGATSYGIMPLPVVNVLPSRSPPLGENMLRLMLFLFSIAVWILMRSRVLAGAGDEHVKWVEDRLTQGWMIAESEAHNRLYMCVVHVEICCVYTVDAVVFFLGLHLLLIKLKKKEILIKSSDSSFIWSTVQRYSTGKKMKKNKRNHVITSEEMMIFLSIN